MERLLHQMLPILALAVVNYYATTFSIWLGHWVSHRQQSPFRDFHVLGHHVLYPTSRDMLSHRFRYGSGRHDSIVALIPWLVLQVAGLALVLPLWLVPGAIVELVAGVALLSYLHVQFHQHGSGLAKFDWFMRARAAHAVHHDRDKNYMVVDHFWDRRFHTYCDPGASTGAAAPPQDVAGSPSGLPRGEFAVWAPGSPVSGAGTLDLTALAGQNNTAIHVAPRQIVGLRNSGREIIKLALPSRNA
jgi:hypothetical protein